MEISSQEKLLIDIAKILSDLKIKYVITGGMAVSVWGRPRATFDIDIVVKIIESQASLLVRAFRNIRKAGYADEEMVKDAIRHKSEFNFIDPDSGLKVDFWVTKKENLFEFKNKKLKKFRDQNIYFVSPEDLILNKLQWQKETYSTKHLEDAKSVLAISGKKLDMDYLIRQAGKLKILDDLNDLIKKSSN